MTRYVIITPARDEEDHLAETIAAVASQTILPLQWIIVNDGSTDQTGVIPHAKVYNWSLDKARAPRQLSRSLQFPHPHTMCIEQLKMTQSYTGR